ncbi:UL46 [anatid alphaherpesvirus 1]|uniref:Tegument protein n=1 Tax=anatid alphaherpesvirus 1 TaxID=104388 RepID=A1YZN5_9ALPH|nr:UL46 [Anatid alphaherpesvirus 1]YP_010795328.1 UL46 [Anatid alphaherpesvirus 1]AHD45934.1 UL46 [BAC cloning vector pDEV-vac]QWQ49763.1 UL46 [BAC cloning vector pDEV-CHa]ABM05715.1 tegument protein [Anatid alphaherpesvirus 1]ABP65272.1 tegument protein UL46 [Anatid alphaherpesvirus 1]ABU49247.1 UL46 [Anatid alphaherpesvirus 1]
MSSRAPSYSLRIPELRSSRCGLSGSDLIARRLREGCIIHRPQDVSLSALRALEAEAEKILPFQLFATQRTEVLLKTRCNNVPESIIISNVMSDTNGAYISNYASEAKATIKDTGLNKGASWSVILARYWKYLRHSSGADIVVNSSTSSTRALLGNVTPILILRSTFEPKPLSKRPLKGKKVTASYLEQLTELKSNFDLVQRYMFYMRPEDPMQASISTDIRLREIMTYNSILYRWILWFMDLFDSNVLRAMGYVTGTNGAREARQPEMLFGRHLRSGPGATDTSGNAVALTWFTHNVLSSLLKISVLWSSSKWHSGTNGVSSAIVAAVELVTMVHHHCQYLVNMIMAGYICWIKGGAKDTVLQSALRSQGRFCHFIGRLAPTMTVHSWSEMEKGTRAWFKMAHARSIITHGKPTKHYLTTVGSVDDPFADTVDNSDDDDTETLNDGYITRYGSSIVRSSRASGPGGPYRGILVKQSKTDSEEDLNPYLHMDSPKSPLSISSFKSRARHRRTSSSSSTKTTRNDPSYWFADGDNLFSVASNGHGRIREKTYSLNGQLNTSTLDGPLSGPGTSADGEYVDMGQGASRSKNCASCDTTTATTKTTYSENANHCFEYETNNDTATGPKCESPDDVYETIERASSNYSYENETKFATVASDLGRNHRSMSRTSCASPNVLNSYHHGSRTDGGSPVQFGDDETVQCQVGETTAAFRPRAYCLGKRDRERELAAVQRVMNRLSFGK